MNYSLLVSSAKGLEYLLEEEVKNLGLQVSRVSPQGVFGEAGLGVLYQLCLWSRLANRVQVILFNGQAANEQELYNLCFSYPWQTVFMADKTFAIEFHGESKQFRNSMFGAQVIKDGIVDHFKKLNNSRPSVDKENPQIKLHAYLKQQTITVSLDLTGYSLHQRGYRQKAGEAPLKETLASAILLRANWPALAKQGYVLHDPFCGVGTLVIEAAMMAAQIAPGLLRHDQAFINWVQHQPALWEKLRAEALKQVKPPAPIKLIGTDNDPRLITIARQNAELAGVAPMVEFITQEVKDIRAAQPQGLLVGNPPYGKRLGDMAALVPLYQQLGITVHTYFQGWQAAIFTENPLLAKATGLRAAKQYTLFNGQLECKLYCMTLNAENHLKNNTARQTLSAGAEMFANRLTKNFKHLQKWAKRNQISCYRVYDADLVEYAFAIDIYNDQVVLQEYTAPANIAQYKTEKRSLEVIQVVPMILGITADKLIIKKRQPQKGKEQYQKINQTSRSLIVQEGKAKFKVNLSDYIDTGLFLDHRPLRLSFAKLMPKIRFLNCFCYTGTASVQAALAGALTTNVDLSNTYLSWAKENFKLNQISLVNHQFIQDDCLEWLKKERNKYEVIFLDPPSFSNSKRMSTVLDIVRDQQFLIDQAMRLLTANGQLYFSTNLRHFKLAAAIAEKYQVKNITAETIDLDFKRNPRIHQCFIISKKI